MNELIKINDDNRVDGRELHEFLQLDTPFKKWIDRMIDDYGFVMGTDFWTKMSKTSPMGGRPSTEYTMTIGMAKEICMIQRNERGKQARLYFIECERRLQEQARPKSQIEILVESVKILQTHERELANLRMDNEEIRKEQKVQSTRIDTLNGVCVEGTKRQKLVKMVNAYANKNGLAFERAWRDFKTAFNTAYNTNLTTRRNNYMERMGIKKMSIPEFLEAEGLLDDALRVADKMLNGGFAA